MTQCSEVLIGSFRRDPWQIIGKHVQVLSDYMNIFYLPLNHVMKGHLDERDCKMVQGYLSIQG
jgi:hypothetical protein